ncbi:hypothetical protein [Christiangramia oceanisediminis]|nr:hypothetical protein [Gramella oceanisediminis]
MKIPKSYWFFIIAALITIIGIVTGWYFFLLILFPLGWFGSNKK